MATMKKGEKILIYSAVTFAGLYFLFHGLVAAGPFLIPLLTAMVMAFLMLPISYKLEYWGFKRIWATITSTLILLILTLGFFFVVFLQIRSFTEDWERIQEQIQIRSQEIAAFLIENTPLEPEHLDGFIPSQQDDNSQVPIEQHEGNESLEQSQAVQHQGQNGQSQNEQAIDQNNEENTENNEEENQEENEGPEAQDMGQQAITVVGAVLSFITDFIIVFVYVFLFIHFRDRFKNFILRFFPKDKREEVAITISRSSSVSRGYLAGRLLLMVILTVMYYTGLAISGLENAFLISLLAAALSIIPFVGNFIGYFIAIAVSLLTDGDTGQILGITITFIVAQFIDSYILQPIVLGGKVNVHPFFIIVSVILGFQIWGVMGMVLAIPIFGMITVVCRHVPALNPLGYLFSNKDIEEPADKPESDSTVIH